MECPGGGLYGPSLAQRHMQATEHVILHFFLPSASGAACHWHCHWRCHCQFVTNNHASGRGRYLGKGALGLCRG